uniref:AMP-binding domain-containing protein n=1 Tax=Caenorhabditis tropicalis TaxID=1561998 RepID=A0A1I7T487_9PELO
MIFHGEKLEHSDKPIHEVLLERFDIHHKADPDSLAFVTAEDEKDSVTFGQLYKKIVQISEWFVENGYKKGDVVLLASYNNWRCFAAALGAWRAGVTVSAASSQFTSYEMRYQIEDCHAKLIIVDSHTISTVLEATKGLSFVKNIVTISPNPPSPVIQFVSLLARLVRNLRMPSIDPSTDLIFLPYSSGTTGKPKGVMITHLNFSMMLEACVKFFNGAHKALGLPEDFVFPHDLHFLPMYHVMGLFRALITSYRGTTQVLFTKFNMELMLKFIEEYSIAILALVPAIAVRLANSPDLLKKYDISSLSTISVGSAPLPVGAVQKLKQMLPNLKVVQGYGMTELTFATHLQSPDSPEGSVGRPIPGTSMKVKKEDGTLCKPHEVGELWIKGPQMMKGYWKKENLLQELVDEDGFMRTGDIVYFDKNGETFICDRIKELIKVNAKQVAPAELESIALEHDDVADVCVFGVDDANSGERPVACVVPKGKRDLDTMKAIMKHVNRKFR